MLFLAQDLYIDTFLLKMTWMSGNGPEKLQHLVIPSENMLVLNVANGL